MIAKSFFHSIFVELHHLYHTVSMNIKIAIPYILNFAKGALTFSHDIYYIIYEIYSEETISKKKP